VAESLSLRTYCGTDCIKHGEKMRVSPVNKSRANFTVESAFLTFGSRSPFPAVIPNNKKEQIERELLLPDSFVKATHRPRRY
jgi:hypothetical protein